MLRYRLGTIKDFHWGFKPVLSYSKPHTFSAFFWRRKEINVNLLSPILGYPGVILLATSM